MSTETHIRLFYIYFIIEIFLIFDICAAIHSGSHGANQKCSREAGHGAGEDIL